MKWDDLINAVGKGDVDLALSGFSIPQNNSPHVVFSLPYLMTTVHIMGLAKTVKGSLNQDMLNDITIGVTDYEYTDQIKNLKLKNTKEIIFSQDNLLVDALKEGKIKFAFIDTYTASYWDVNSSGTIKDYGSLANIKYPIGIAINSKEQELLKDINKALLDYQNSQLYIDNYDHDLMHL